MRSASLSLLVLTATLLSTASAHAQAEKRFKVDKDKGVQVGFQNVLRTTATDGFKTGMWTPVIVTLEQDDDGEIRLPIGADNYVKGEILVETADNEGVLNTYPQEFTQRLTEKSLRVVAYTKVASRGAEIKVTVKSGDDKYPVWTKTYNALQVGWHLYLTLGESLPDLRDALLLWAAERGGGGQWEDQGGGGQGGGGKVKGGPKVQPQTPADKNTVPRFAVFENSVAQLPAQWFGYSAVDLVILPTASGDFLGKNGLLGPDANAKGIYKGTEQLKALAEWVRRGGRLVISISTSNKALVRDLLTSEVWQPALPLVLNKESALQTVNSFRNLQSWSGALNDPIEMPKKNDVNVVLLERIPQVEVVEKTDDDAGTPLIVRFPHGMGSIVLLAFDVKSEPLASWKGRFKFWQKVVERFAPSTDGFFYGDTESSGSSEKDTSTILFDELEKFDSPTVSFGWVVLFIFIYILVVGPIDYLLLKLVFKRLELTWLTFPTVVVTVSVLAYFTAYALKGRDLKINKIDLIDIDLRSELGADLRPAGATAYGTTWFTILSPRIQNYTIGIEPMAGPWLLVDKIPTPTVTWLGRAEPVSIGGTGRTRSQGLFSRTYAYEPDAIGLRDVPIPVWTTKAFTASWSLPFKKGPLPLEVDLYYEAGRSETVIGTIKSNLPSALQGVGIIYQGKWYPLKNNRDVTELSKDDGIVKVRLPVQQTEDLVSWLRLSSLDYNRAGGSQNYDSGNQGTMQDPWSLFRRVLFFEGSQQKNKNNHALRALDWSWRVKSDDKGADGRVREAVLVARLQPASGSLETLQAANDPRLGTLLWLGDVPGSDKTRPNVPGNLVQFTYVRVIVPVRSKKD